MRLQKGKWKSHQSNFLHATARRWPRCLDGCLDAVPQRCISFRTGTKPCQAWVKITPKHYVPDNVLFAKFFLKISEEALWNIFTLSIRSWLQLIFAMRLLNLKQHTMLEFRYLIKTNNLQVLLFCAIHFNQIKFLMKCFFSSL